MPFAPAVEEAVAAGPFAIISVLDYAVVREILDSLGDVASGRVLVNLTTGAPDQARQTARWAAEHGAGYLDGGSLADPEQIGTPGARFYYSGSHDAFEAHQARLKVLG